MKLDYKYEFDKDKGNWLTIVTLTDGDKQKSLAYYIPHWIEGETEMFLGSLTYVFRAISAELEKEDSGAIFSPPMYDSLPSSPKRTSEA